MKRGIGRLAVTALIGLCGVHCALAVTRAEAIAGEGDRYFKAGQYQSAIAAYKKSIALDPSRGLTYYGLALCYHQRQEWELAVGAWKHARALLQPEAAMFLVMGADYFHLKRYRDALDAFGNAAGLDPGPQILAMVRYWTGLTYKEMNQPDRAVSPLEQAIRLRPQFADACYELGLVYLAMNRDDDALRVYRELKAFDDAKAEELHAEILLHGGKIGER